jgi:hypothetical protein
MVGVDVGKYRLSVVARWPDKKRGRSSFNDITTLKTSCVLFSYASCPVYALGQHNPLVNANPAYLELSPDVKRRQILWQEFLVSEDVREETIRRADWVVGDGQFRKHMAQLLGRPSPRRPGRPKTSEVAGKRQMTL